LHNQGPFALASSADGSILVAVIFGGDIWTSNDGGTTWTDDTTGTSGANKHYAGITSSSDGTELAAIVGGGFFTGDIYTGLLVNPPTVTTSAVSSIGLTSATLNGNITATGGQNATAEGFVWGTSTSYGATTTESGSFGTGSFTAALSSLTCNTAYHFAAYATNGYLGYSTDTTFTTSACPVAVPAPSNGAPVGLLGGGGGGGGSVAAALPNNGSESATTTIASASATPITATVVTSTTSTTSSATTAALVSLYTELLQLLQQELSTLMAMRGG
jgi:hypothetical protein